jgi:hypothetical protein
MSLSEYGDRKSYDSADLKVEPEQLSRGSYDSEKEKSKRNLIYGSESFKETP